MHENDIGKAIVNEAVRVHRDTGPGLFESVYEAILEYRLKRLGMTVGRQVEIPIMYDEIRFEAGFRADLIVDQKVIVELKCVERLGSSHKKQVLTYLRLSGLRLGFLLNFNESLMKNGIHRIVNQL